MGIAYKEARETHYWLRQIRDSNILDAKQAKSIMEDYEELLKLSGSIILTTKPQIKDGAPGASFLIPNS